MLFLTLFKELYMYAFVPIILIVVNAFLTASEKALISMNDSKLEKMSAGGNKKAGKLKKLTDKPSEFLSSISSAFFIISIIASSLIAADISVPISESIVEIYHTEWRYVIIIAFSLIFAFLNTVFGRIIPEKLFNILLFCIYSGRRTPCLRFI